LSFLYEGVKHPHPRRLQVWSQVRETSQLELSLFVAGFVVITLAALFLGFALPVRRSRRLEQMACELNFKFSARAKPFEHTDTRGLTILPDGPSTVVDNLLERTVGQCRFLILDINDFPVESATTVPVTTAAAFHMPALHLPVFHIGEKNSIERVVEQIEHAFGRELDEFDGNREFTRNFFIHCPAKGEVRNFLTPGKLTYLREHAAHFDVECSPDWLLIYRFGVKVETEDLNMFSEVTSGLASALLSVQLPKAS
jgi:hypothetical protein